MFNITGRGRYYILKGYHKGIKRGERLVSD